VWPIHLNFLFLISKFISSWPVAFRKSLLETIFGHHTLRMYLRHRITKVCILRRISLVTSHVSHPDMIHIYCNWVSSRWPLSLDLFKNSEETAIYKTTNNTNKIQNYKTHNIENKHKKNMKTNTQRILKKHESST
jgi:hypothetical protein